MAGIPGGEGSNDHRVEHGEHRRCHPDAEAQDEHGRQGKGGRPAEASERVAQFSTRPLPPGPAPLEAGDFLHLNRVAELAPGGVLGFLRVFPPGDALVYRHGEVGADLVRQIGIARSAGAEERPVHGASSAGSALRIPAIAALSASHRERSVVSRLRPAAVSS